MGAGDLMPQGGSSRSHTVDPKRLKKIQEGGKRADQIKKQMERQHQALEVPQAEEELLNVIKNLND